MNKANGKYFIHAHYHLFIHTHYFLFRSKGRYFVSFYFFSNENNFLIKWFAFKKARTTQKLFGEKEPFWWQLWNFAVHESYMKIHHNRHWTGKNNLCVVLPKSGIPFSESGIPFHSDTKSRHFSWHCHLCLCISPGLSLWV